NKKPCHDLKPPRSGLVQHAITVVIHCHAGCKNHATIMPINYVGYCDHVLRHQAKLIMKKQKKER
ncbi:MAG: hypothetical protein KAX49_16510, partial [Halanaerobiales bacterium]|nr:hypothetical protein [Halanaerobiales bacterium]